MAVIVGEQTVVLREGCRRPTVSRAPGGVEALVRRVAAAGSSLAIADASPGPLASMRALLGASFASGRGALLVWDRRPRDIEPAAVACIERLAGELDAWLMGGGGR